MKISGFWFANRGKKLHLVVKPYKNGCRCPWCGRHGRIVHRTTRLRRHHLPDRWQPRYPCTDPQRFAYTVKLTETPMRQLYHCNSMAGNSGYRHFSKSWTSLKVR